ncbi:MAG: diguanylate cyclase [Dehalococcoidia bacterium]|nr:diguanylate cyclase [Dehalococcoidia bacterium]
MNIYALIPLIATIAYIPLLVILLVNRPWQKRQQLFLLFLISAMLWSALDVFSRSGFFIQNHRLTVGVILSLGMWSIIQFHYFLCSFYSTRPFKIPVGYLIAIGTVALAILGYIPQGIEVTISGIHVQYGKWFILMIALATPLLIRDFYSLLRKVRISADPLERNQVLYLFLGVFTLIAIASISLAPFGAQYPLAHVGNLLLACILTYTVVAHRLLDVRVVLREALSFSGMAAFLVVTFFVWLLLLLKAFGLELGFPIIIIAMLGTLAVAAVCWYRVRSKIFGRMDRVFYGERIEPRHRLHDFIAKIYSIPTLEQFGSQLVSLLSQSVDCQKACLLLPQSESGDFAARFGYPPVEDNPMAKLKLRHDSPVVTWLKREAQALPERNLSILPEFQGLWQGEKEDIQSAKVEIFVPLINKGELVAILAVGNKRNGKFYCVEEIDLMESIAGQVAAGMEKEYIHEQLEQQDRELTLVNRLTTIVTSSMNIKEIFEGFAQELKKVVDVDWGTIALIEGFELRFLALTSTIGSAWQAGERIPLSGTATEWVAREEKPLYEANLERHKRFWTGEHHLRRGIRSIVYLPLVVRGEGIGSLTVASRRVAAYNPGQIRLLEHLALQIATPIENSQLYARAEQRARIDELTGLFNRRHFEERLKEEITRHSRYGNVFSLFMLDLDNFKTYNDIYGHPAGDELLDQIGSIIRSSIRNADQAFRYGGDEFTVILPQTSGEDAYVVAERVREQLASEMKAKEVAITCSIGLASYPSDGVMSGELVTASDTALYYAKHTGGNRTYLSAKILSEPLTEAGANARGGGLSAVYALVSAVDAKDHYTYGHSRKVNTYAVALAEAIGLSPDEVSRVSTAALLHDIGKIGIPDKILSKKGKLATGEWEAIKSHPKLGANIIGNVPSLVSCLPGILYHHERWDGTGYPEGLKGETIPLDARILAIADAFTAMTSARPYRDAFCDDKAIKQLRQGASKQFDPHLVEVFIGLVEAGFPEKAKVGQDPSSEQPNL